MLACSRSGSMEFIKGDSMRAADAVVSGTQLFAHSQLRNTKEDTQKTVHRLHTKHMYYLNLSISSHASIMRI